MKINVKVDLKNIAEAHGALIRQHVASKAAEVKHRLQEATPVDTGAARDAWQVSSQGDKLIISNDKEYISELNAGSSRQAPSHFVEKTVLSVKNVLPNGVIVTYAE